VARTVLRRCAGYLGSGEELVLRAVVLDMFPQTGGVGVALVAARHRALVGLRGQMRALVLGAVAGVGEGLPAAAAAHVRPLARVRTLVDLQVLQPTERLAAAGERAAVRALAGVHAHVDEQLVARVEGPVLARARRPEAREVVAASLVHVRALDMARQLGAVVEHGAAVHPAAHPRLCLLGRHWTGALPWLRLGWRTG